MTRRQAAKRAGGTATSAGGSATGAGGTSTKAPGGGGAGPDGTVERPVAADLATAADLDAATDEALLEEVPSREGLVNEAKQLAAGTPGLPELLDRYWRLVPDEELFGRTGEDLYQATVAHRALAEQRLPGEAKIAITTSEERTGLAPHTVVQVVTDDMPFLVDSVTAALTARGLEVHLLVHPQLVVRREFLGKLAKVCPEVELDDAGPDELVESWIQLEVDRQRDSERLEELRRDITSVLTDVREVVEDWQKMRHRALEIADELATPEAAALPVPAKDITDTVDLLRWLTDDNFTFLGYREYKLVDGEVLQAVLGTGLGVLRTDQQTPRVLSSISPEAYAKALEKRLLIITKANARATVYRPAYLDYVGVKTFDEEGNVAGERRFLGLLASAAYLHSVRELPVVKRKVAEVIERSGLPPRSHSGRDLVEILETYPRDELFQTTTNELFANVLGVLRLAGRRQLRLFLRKDAYGRFMSCLVYLPRDRFTTANRLKIQDILLRELNGIGVDYTTRVSESTLARIHFIVRTDPAHPPRDYDVDAIQQQLIAATRHWDDDFNLALERKLGEEQSKQLYHRYVNAFPQTYKDEVTPGAAVKDLAKLELLDEPGQLAMHLYRKRNAPEQVRFKVFRYGEPMMLSAVLPVLHSLGVKVADERPYEIQRDDGVIYLYDFGLQPPENCLDMAEIQAKVENAFASAWRGESEVDRFNELVLRAGLTWRQVVVLRSYAKYLRQAGTPYSQDYMQSTFTEYPGVAALLVALFETRFSPALAVDSEQRAQFTDELVDAINAELDRVSSLDQDRILRSFLNLVLATLRTNFFQRGEGDGGRPKSYISFKLEPQKIPELPLPRPRYEIFVYSPRLEGVHLRFGAVARGGLRWSDRREDFRTEILGLVKAQSVKNAVIVPVGAKGGFVLKQAPPASDRDAFFAEGQTCYKMFISALLDITDNLDSASGKVLPPPQVVRHDGDDTYLVVAADKGTATFSDTANAIALEYGFWLGDAFASGGSVGYDHKKMGITARGAWESVKHNFRELARGSDEHGREIGVDTQTEDFTAAGIGDMSGDVFGNGMLCSEHIRLVAAFDHRHVFVDPSPDAAVGYRERKRLFGLPRSSWEDYDRSLISEGGGVWPRTAKSIPVSPRMREALGITDSSITELPPPELIKAVLRAPVDLLWNGGIGTYVKAAAESHADVGDKANDPVRVDGRELRCEVVGEGGNLGLTQRGRIEYALSGAGGEGGRINTDFIDNSGGVDCSDHEVNIKILLNRAIAESKLPAEDRVELLASMTDEVAALVLTHNYDQATALGNARRQAAPLLSVHRRLIKDLERSGRLDRELEALPTEKELQARAQNGTGLTSPEFAVLLSYAKLKLEDEILDSELPDEEWTRELLVDYFPTPLRERFSELTTEHPLRREIVTTLLVNEAVNRGGTTFFFRAVEETGASVADLLRAYVVVRDVFGLRELWRAAEALDNKVPSEAQVAVFLESRRLLDRAVRWLVQTRTPVDVPAEIARLRPGVSELLPRVGTLFCGTEAEALREWAAKLAKLGVPEELADWSTRLMYGFGLLDVVEVGHALGTDVDQVAGVYYALSERFKIDALLDRVSALSREDRWQTLARMALRYDLYAALAALTAEVLAATPGGLDAAARIETWEQANASNIARARNAIGEFGESQADLAALSVVLRQIRTLVRSTALASSPGS
ncbi:MAG: NAD-glutamate dehydrogenase [Micromonosporaceae bacterium]